MGAVITVLYGIVIAIIVAVVSYELARSNDETNKVDYGTTIEAERMKRKIEKMEFKIEIIELKLGKNENDKDK